MPVVVLEPTVAQVAVFDPASVAAIRARGPFAQVRSGSCPELVSALADPATGQRVVRAADWFAGTPTVGREPFDLRACGVTRSLIIQMRPGELRWWAVDPGDVPTVLEEACGLTAQSARQIEYTRSARFG